VATLCLPLNLSRCLTSYPAPPAYLTSCTSKATTLVMILRAAPPTWILASGQDAQWNDIDDLYFDDPLTRTPRTPQ